MCTTYYCFLHVQYIQYTQLQLERSKLDFVIPFVNTASPDSIHMLYSYLNEISNAYTVLFMHSFTVIDYRPTFLFVIFQLRISQLLDALYCSQCLSNPQFPVRACGLAPIEINKKSPLYYHMNTVKQAEKCNAYWKKPFKIT